MINERALNGKYDKDDGVNECEFDEDTRELGLVEPFDPVAAAAEAVAYLAMADVIAAPVGTKFYFNGGCADSIRKLQARLRRDGQSPVVAVTFGPCHGIYYTPAHAKFGPGNPFREEVPWVVDLET